MSQYQMTGMVGEQSQDVFERMFRAVELVQERLNRACRALREAKVPYAVIGGNALAAWVAFSMRHGQIGFRYHSRSDFKPCWTIQRAEHGGAGK